MMTFLRPPKSRKLFCIVFAVYTTAVVSGIIPSTSSAQTCAATFRSVNDNATSTPAIDFSEMLYRSVVQKQRASADRQMPREFERYADGKTFERLPHDSVLIAGQTIAVPLGMSPTDFANLVEAFRLAKAAEGLIIFDSRTHYTYGTVLGPDSDLDVIAFGAAKQIASETKKTQFVEWIERKLRRAIQDTRIPANYLPMYSLGFYPPARTLDSYFEAGILNSLTVAESRDRWVQYFRQMLRGAPVDDFADFDLGWESPRRMVIPDPRNVLKSEFVNGTQEVFNKEAIFLIRRSATSAAAIQKLRDHHYTNVIELP